MNKIVPPLLFLIAIQWQAAAQQRIAYDSLTFKSYAYFIEKLENDGEPVAAVAYAKAYRNKAKQERNDLELVKAYKALLHQSQGNERVRYADSMIETASHSKNQNLLGSAHLTKGIVWYDQKKYQLALDQYLKADELLENGNDEYLKYKLRYNIGLIKYYLGFFEEAQVIFTDCVQHFKSQQDTPYLSALHSLGLCYTSLGKYGLASETNELGIKEAILNGNTDFIAYFKHAEGVNQYFLKNYKKSLSLLEQVLPEVRRYGHQASETIAYLYMAKCHLAMGKNTEAIPLLQKIDSAFLMEEYMRPDLRETYEHLIKYHRKKGDLKSELYYTNRLLQADSLIEKNFRYLSSKMHKVFNTKELRASKTAIEKELQSKERNNRILTFMMMGAAIIIVMLIKRQIKTRKATEKIVANDNKKAEETNPKKPGTEEIGFSDEVVDNLLKGLVRFESSRKFLEKDLTLPKLAASFKSNPKYVAKVILAHRGMKYTDYINSLKIEYLKKLLEENKQVRKYTIKALANEAGFNTAQHLHRAFVKHSQISTAEFIKTLD